jgi:hypothetical protein
MTKYTYGRTGGYEVSTQGDKRFSALVARMSDGRTIEEWYQCNIKGYPTWKEGKGKPPLREMSREKLWQCYLLLWEIWAGENPELLADLRIRAANAGYHLSDRFASTDVSQARALASILNNESSHDSTNLYRDW